MSQITLIEQRERTGAYDLGVTEMIVDHPKHGRLWISEGYGGESELQGGAYRWRHGIACQLRPSDTFGSLEALSYNDMLTEYDSLKEGRSHTRPLLPWLGGEINAIAESARA